MTVRRFRRHDRPGVKYIAHQVGGLLDPLPQWFQELVAKGVAKDGEDCPSVKTITGDWRRVAQGGWIVYQQNGWLWELADADFNNLFYEVA